MATLMSQHKPGDGQMDSMATLMRRRRLRGLVIHHRRHPSKHARRLVLRTQRWTDTRVRGVCRWCEDPAATIDLTWHRYCLDAYRVASGQHPAELQRTMCEVCAGPSDELDHKLAINVARALGSEALRRAFVQENLRWLCHIRKTRFDRLLARYLRVCGLDWHGALRALAVNHEWASEFLRPFGIEFDRKNAARPDFKTAV